MSAHSLSPAFRRLACSNLSAQFSEQIALAAAPLVAVLALGAGPAQTGLLQTAQTLPFLLLSLPAGVLADRTSRRRLMLGAEALRAASLLGVLALLATGRLGLGALAVLGCMGAAGTVAYSVAAPAMLPGLVARAQLAAANRWLELARSTAFAAGPALGGAAVGWLGAQVAYGGAAGLSVLAVALLAGLPDTCPSPGARQTAVRALRDGAGFVARQRLLRPVLAISMVFNTAWFVLQAVYVAYAVDRLGLSAGGVGLTLGVYGAGMVAGAALAPWLLRRLPFGLVVAVGPASALAASAAMLATLAVPSGWLAGAAFMLFGAGPILWTITTTTVRQLVTPPGLLGRVSAVIMTASFGARPLGAALGALLSGWWGMEACLWVSAAGFAAQFVLLAFSPLVQVRTQAEVAAAAAASYQRP